MTLPLGRLRTRRHVAVAAGLSCPLEQGLQATPRHMQRCHPKASASEQLSLAPRWQGARARTSSPYPSAQYRTCAPLLLHQRTRVDLLGKSISEKKAAAGLCNTGGKVKVWHDVAAVRSSGALRGRAPWILRERRAPDPRARCERAGRGISSRRRFGSARRNGDAPLQRTWARWGAHHARSPL